MESREGSGQSLQRPYRQLRDDPRYGELKRVIEKLPLDKIERLKVRLRELEEDA